MQHVINQIVINQPRSILTPDLSSAESDQISRGANLFLREILEEMFAPREI